MLRKQNRYNYVWEYSSHAVQATVVQFSDHFYNYLDILDEIHTSDPLYNPHVYHNHLLPIHMVFQECNNCLKNWALVAIDVDQADKYCLEHNSNMADVRKLLSNILRFFVATNRNVIRILVYTWKAYRLNCRPICGSCYQIEI